LDFPATPVAPTAAPADLIEALGITPAFVGKGQEDYLIEVDGEAMARALTPDLTRLAEAPPTS